MIPDSSGRARAGDLSGRPRILEVDRELLRELEQAGQDALRVISRLERYGHQAYLVGGCVRDLMIGRAPKDFDVATSAHPRQIKRLFRNGRIIGRRFRLVHVRYGERVIETSTFRSDPAERDGEELEDLLIVEDNEYGTAEEDARRRDFTVNGLFLDPTRMRIIDYVGGLVDLESGLLRAIGNPQVRMAEDPVRILRAIKFATRLAFRIEDQTWQAMLDHAEELARSAAPRVFEEILRLMRSGTSLGAFRKLRSSGALRVILPPVADHLDPPVDGSPEVHDRIGAFWRLLEALDSEVHRGFEPSAAVCIGLLFHDIIERQADPERRSLPGEPRDLLQVTGEVLEPMAEAARLARRDTARARRIILQQRRFLQTSTKRFRPRLFCLSEDFPESLELFRLRSQALGQGWDIYEAWVERAKRAHEASSDELHEERRATRGKRRRRGGRGAGRRRGGEELAAEPSRAGEEPA